MRLAYTMTEHAKERMRQRRINPLDAIAALQNKAHLRTSGVIHYYDPRSRVRVVVNPTSNTIVTVYKTGGRA